MTFERDAIIGWNLAPGELQSLTSATLEYETKYVGKVKITIPAYTELLNGDFERFLIAGICKHRTNEIKEPVLIDSNFIRGGYKYLNPPIDFEEKAYAFLKYIYSNGGRENHDFEFNSTKDFPLAYAAPQEFERILDNLEKENYISIRKKHRIGGREASYLYIGVRLTKEGKKEAEKALPKLPMIGLVNHEITTGEAEIDEKIIHARKLFFDEPFTMDKMRSACETLSYVLEPLRKDLETFFKLKDVSDFFQIVNNFDIRHNKDNTKDIIYEEQLEWVFYTLLNTINTYTKLKRKLS
jgi:DNA-binding PadR family transcriptional regulator